MTFRSAAPAVTILLLASTAGLQADSPMIIKGAETIGEAVVPYVFDGDLRSLPLAPDWKPGDPIKEIPRRHNELPSFFPTEQESGTDPLVERQLEAPRVPQDPQFHIPILNIPGQGFSGVNPPDTVGDASPDHYIQSINGGGGAIIAIYNKSGTVVSGPFFLDSLGAGPCASGLGDPIILYDELADRWVLTEFSGGGNRMCVYVSQTADPISGGWFNYDFQAPSFPDYPKYGVWHDAYYVSSNENQPASYAFDRENMLLGNPARPHQRFTAPPLNGFGFQATTPADHDGALSPAGNEPGIFMRHKDTEAHGGGGANSDFLELFFFDVDWDNPGNSSFTGPVQIEIAEIDSNMCGLFAFACFDQPGGGPDLDPLREVVMHRLQYQNFGTHEALVGNLVTDASVDQGAVRWFELRKTGSNWTLFQEGTYSIDSADRWMGGITQDKMGNIAVGYNVVDDTANVFPGLRYVGRLSTDPLGTMTQGEHSFIEGTMRNNSNRYGDYSAMSLDPADGCTMWFTGEYNTAGAWSTRIAAIKFDECGGPPPAAPTIELVGGSCGGTVNIKGSGFTPNKEVGMVGAANTSGFTKGGILCPGATFEVGEPFNLPPTFAKTDGSGGFTVSMDTEVGFCFVEALDLLGTCQTSNVLDTDN